ncbi:hypothetical protein [Flavobacterium lipolyticum]|uniref:Uncharacterized protein n=1 Tax=Flavobacterium lipolyticum TaxID=2893754 RepID=A0ABS8LWK4_9FLAO|nr:hypothetical protein [Flavobacterium sp. F-126]MCC9016923.1 hypothetical protein [Flavobacterium sp. F-126]
MIYDSLDTIPYKTFLKIVETGNLSLLSRTETKEEILIDTWAAIYEEHVNRENATPQGKKLFRISKEIESLEYQLKVVLFSCDALKFEYDEDLDNLLTVEYGFILRTTDEVVYYEDIAQIERESKAFKVKIGVLKQHLPKLEAGQQYTIDDILASYCSILGFHIGDFNSITYNAYFGYEKQVNAKIEASKKQETTKKK